MAPLPAEQVVALKLVQPATWDVLANVYSSHVLGLVEPQLQRWAEAVVGAGRPDAKADVDVGSRLGEACSLVDSFLVRSPAG